MALDPASLSYISYGLYVVTSRDGERLNGQIANAVVQVTASPCRVAVALSKNNLIHDFVAAARAFGVSVLTEETPMTFIGLFGFKSGRDINKFADVRYRVGETGCPLVEDYAVAVFDARVIASLDVGTHTVYVGEVATGEVIGAGKPLTYAAYREIKKGKTPANAPTYQGKAAAAPAAKRRTDGMKKYICQVCGYVYDPAAGDAENGVAPGTAFEDLPGDWVCPVCGAAKDQFEPEA